MKSLKERERKREREREEKEEGTLGYLRIPVKVGHGMFRKKWKESMQRMSPNESNNGFPGIFDHLSLHWKYKCKKFTIFIL